LEVNIIFDSRRPEKYDPIIAELKRQDIRDYTIWAACMLPTVVESISESFKMIITKAKRRGLKEVAIWEDDCYFPSEKGWKYFIDNKPENYSIYIGGNYLIDNRLVYAPPIMKVESYVGNHCIIVHESYYDIWLSTNSKDHCDTVHNGLGDFYVCFPFPALQRSGWSSNVQAIVNYNAIFNTANLEGYIYK
jgi:hypothetical protein